MTDQPSQPDVCTLCGGPSIPAKPLYLRTISANQEVAGETLTWQNFESQCCESCFRRLAKLEKVRFLMNFGLVPFFLSMIPLFMVDPEGAVTLPLVSAGVGFGLLVASLIGMGIIGMMRKSIVSAPHFADTMEQLKQAHEASTGQPLLRVVPLTKVKQGSSVFELDR